MLRLPTIWKKIQESLSSEDWTSLSEIYQLFEDGSLLDDEDFLPEAPGSSVPKWKRNVRNVLQYRKRKGQVLWNGNSHYKLVRKI
jgi:hypothetical protein